VASWFETRGVAALLTMRVQDFMRVQDLEDLTRPQKVHDRILEEARERRLEG
jgi:hypothetical protein